MSSYLKHITHLEELFVLDGEEGFKKSIQILSKCMAMLTKQPTPDFHINVKFDGSPSIIFGTHPETGKYFVAKKSFFNKKKSIYYNNCFEIHRDESLEDDLKNKLMDCFDSLEHFASKGHVYQGDLLYHTYGSSRKFTANLITYKTSKLNTCFGVSVHTKYVGNSMETLRQTSNVNHNLFKNWNDLEIVNPTYILKNNYNYSKFLEYLRVLEYAYNFYYENKRVLNSYTNEEKEYFLREVNKCVRLQTFLQSNPLFHSDMKFYIYSCMHNVLVDIKNTVIGHLNLCLDYSKYPMPIEPFDTHEGYVVTLGHEDLPTKLIHRHIFSKLNFDKYSKKYGKDNEQ